MSERASYPMSARLLCTEVVDEAVPCNILLACRSTEENIGSKHPTSSAAADNRMTAESFLLNSSSSMRFELFGMLTRGCHRAQRLVQVVTARATRLCACSGCAHTLWQEPGAQMNP